MKRLPLLFIGLAMLASCKKDDADTPNPNNDEEVITRVDLLAVNRIKPADTLRFINRPEAVQGSPLRIDTIKLDLGATYDMYLRVWNESADPDVVLNNEITNEGTEHQFFWRVNPPTQIGINVDSMDRDANGRPLGLRLRGVTALYDTVGTLRVKLLHELDKAASGVAQGDETLAGGSTDVEITWPLLVR